MTDLRASIRAAQNERAHFLHSDLALGRARGAKRREEPERQRVKRVLDRRAFAAFIASSGCQLHIRIAALRLVLLLAVERTPLQR
jgi:hypothetical protein